MSSGMRRVTTPPRETAPVCGATYPLGADARARELGARTRRCELQGTGTPSGTRAPRAIDSRAAAPRACRRRNAPGQQALGGCAQRLASVWLVRRRLKAKAGSRLASPPRGHPPPVIHTGPQAHSKSKGHVRWADKRHSYKRQRHPIGHRHPIPTQASAEYDMLTHWA